ncbi:MAG: trypsin-like peptidase domain-containing protein [Acidobacteria bacterium]|nr:trypsin-like peptidase domain-containing protein [Acidobacteriota bacterium]
MRFGAGCSGMFGRWRSRRFLAAVVLVCLASLTAPTLAGPADGHWAMIAKASVVRIVCAGTGSFTLEVDGGAEYRHFNIQAIYSGSGFFVNPDGVIVTNAHVVEPAYKGEKEMMRLLQDEYVRRVAAEMGHNPETVSPEVRKAILDRTTFNDDTKVYNLVLLSRQRKLPFTVIRYGAPVGEGKDVALIRVDVRNAPVLAMGDSEEVRIQDHVTVLGFPSAADTSLLSEDSILEPTVTDGIIAARKALEDGTPVLQFTAPVAEGNSGGPAINDRGEVVGIVTFRGDEAPGHGNTGFAYMITASTITEFIRASGVRNEPGPTTRAYRRGMRMFWDEHYAEAARQFDETLRLFPDLSDVARLREECRQMIARGRDKPLTEDDRRRYEEQTEASFGALSPRASLWTWDKLGGLLVLLGVIVGVLAFELWRRSSTRPRAERPVEPDGEARPDAAPVTEEPASGAGDILFVAGPLAHQRFRVNPEGMLLGRDSEVCTVVIDHPDVSARHLWIGLRQGTIVVEDFGSAQGTFINSLDHPLIGETPLNPGDMIILCWTDAARFVFIR